MPALDFMWRGGNTLRYHTMQTLKTDTVGHHSFNVACLIMYLRPECRAELLKAALLHDTAEALVGDMPAPAKRMLPDYPHASFREVFGVIEEKAMTAAGIELPGLTPEEGWVLSFADAVDGMRYGIQERRLGNQSIGPCFENFRIYAARLLYGEDIGAIEQLHRLPVDYAQPQDVKLIARMNKEWFDVNGER